MEHRHGKRASLWDYGPPGPKGAKHWERDDMDDRPQAPQSAASAAAAPLRSVTAKGKGKKGGRTQMPSQKEDRPRQDSKGEHSSQNSTHQPFTIAEVVETNRRLTLRLCRQMREQVKQTQFVLIIKPDPSTEQLRNLLFTARKQYLEDAPRKGEGRGQHDSGPMPTYLFDTFATWFEQELENAPTSAQQFKGAILAWLQKCFPYRGDRTRSAIFSFGAKGNRSRVPALTSAWPWGLAFNYLTKEGLEAHQALLEILECSYGETPLFRISQDSSPPDQLEREMAEMSLLRIARDEF
jgi:hypothetical protein